MLTIILINILTIMSKVMPNTILTISHLPRSDRTKEMVIFARHNAKLAKTISRTDFLLDCRKLGIFPQFIINRTVKTNTDNNEKVAKLVKKLQMFYQERRNQKQF